MSLSERPTYAGRPRLTLPNAVRHAAPAQRSAPDVSAPRRTSGPSGALTLSKAYLARKLGGLAEILGTTIDALPPILRGRVPVPLKVGIRADFVERYPGADSGAIGRWLACWTATDQYRMQVAAGGPRFDLDGAQAGEITAEQAEAARAAAPAAPPP